MGSVTPASSGSLPRGVPPALGRYRLVRPLGAGGMGLLFVARHTLLDRTVALKIVHPDRLNASAVTDRFLREMAALGNLDHPRIVQARDADLDNGYLYLVMELLDGASFHQLLLARGPLPVADAAELTRQAAEGLAYLGTVDLVHRDIKPGNLFLTRRHGVKLLDLGLARLRGELAALFEPTGAGCTLGTADYIAPEQVNGGPDLDIRADVYSLGCTLYRLLENRVPFPVEGFARKLAAHEAGAFPELARADVPDGLRAVLRRMVARDPAHRPWPEQVVDDLAPFAVTGRPEHLLPPAPPTYAGDRTTPIPEPRTQRPEGTQPEAPTTRFFDAPTVAQRPVRQALFAVALVLALFGGLAAWLLSSGKPAAGLPDGPRHLDPGGGRVDLLDRAPRVLCGDLAAWRYHAPARALEIFAPAETLFLLGVAPAHAATLELRLDQPAPSAGVLVVLGLDLEAGTFQAIGTAAEVAGGLALVRCRGRYSPTEGVSIEHVHLSEPVTEPPACWRVELTLHGSQLAGGTFGRKLLRLPYGAARREPPPAIPAGGVGLLVRSARVTVRDAFWSPHRPAQGALP